MLTPRILFIVAAAGLVLGSGCKPKSKEITSLQRKEAETLVTEAQFATQIKDYARAEPLLAKAAALAPDTGKYWIDLGSARVRLGNKAGAKTAYQSGLEAYQAAAKVTPTDPTPVMQQMYALALLGRSDEARAVLEKAVKDYPNSLPIRKFAEGKQIEKMLADARFKEIAL